MAEESTVFGLATLGVIAGSAILIFGVMQNNGEHLNAIMLAGGIVVIAAAGLLTAGVSGLEGHGH
jgi:hypothetical protein